MGQFFGCSYTKAIHRDFTPQEINLILLQGGQYMKFNSADLIKKVRADTGLTQEQLAEQLLMSSRHLGRVESGGANLDVWQYMTVMEIMGEPPGDFWLLFLETKEYEEYRAFRYLKNLLANDRSVEAREFLPNFENGLKSKQPFVRQFVAWAKVVVDEELSNEVAIEALHEVIRMSKPNYDEKKVETYRLTYNEVVSIIEIAGRLFETGQEERAIALATAIVKNKDKTRATEDDRAIFLPSLMFNLSTMLGRTGKYKESLKLCNQAIEICREYSNLRAIPDLLYNIACCHHLLGEEEQVYKTYLIRAYYSAYALGQNEAAKMIKKDAEESFGIIIPAF
jgi:DNA-binding XRE family transcriptional regulator